VGSLWGNVTPFALTSAEQFHVPPPPALTSQEYTDAFNEVKNYGGDGVTTPTLRTPEETQIGIFWAYDGSPGLGTPPREYNQIAETIAVQQGNTVVQNARFFALINLSMADAAITCWDAKYDYNLWRPVTGIRDAGADGNPATTADPNWTPLGVPADNGSGTNFTPPFPSYASGHATFGGALFSIMADFYGRDDVHFTIGSDEFNGVTKDQNGVVRPVVTRSFNSFSQAAEENGQSRIYLGIHWSFDKVQGIQQGNEIADYVFQHLLRPSHDRDRGHDFDAGSERVYEEKATLAGPVLAPVHFRGGEELEGESAFRLNHDLKPVNMVVEVEASRLQETTGKDPMRDLNAVFESPDLFRML
jgi:PAP2 superfamily